MARPESTDGPGRLSRKPSCPLCDQFAQESDESIVGADCLTSDQPNAERKGAVPRFHVEVV